MLRMIGKLLITLLLLVALALAGIWYIGAWNCWKMGSPGYSMVANPVVKNLLCRALI